MKPRLLIALGCSWTEGVGCYDPPLNYNVNTPYNSIEQLNFIKKLYDKNLKNFHENSWPNLLGKKLGFDKVVNLGCGASSNSHNLKILYEYMEDNDISKYDTLIVWLMTEPIRFSFYIGGKIKNFMSLPTNESKIASEYLNEIKYINLDPILEQKFYLKNIETLCELKNIGLVVSSWNNSYSYLHGIYESKYYLHKKPIILEPPFTEDKNGYLVNYSFCSHPNKNGYEWIANQMVEGIRENHSKWYNTKENPNVDYSFKGDSKQYRPNLI